jgi:hypothetical protein
MMFNYVADYLNDVAGFAVVRAVDAGLTAGVVVQIAGYLDAAGEPVSCRMRAARAVCIFPGGEVLNLWGVANAPTVVFH